MSDLAMTREAVISDCGLYRWNLTRVWDALEPFLVFIMLNPSTADSVVDDPTIRVCMGRAFRMKVGGVLIVNLFAFRSTDPSKMMRAASPVGQWNDYWIARALKGNARMVIAAWGDLGRHMRREETVAAMADLAGVPLHCLGTTKAGSPRHPLRIPYAFEPVIWRRAT